jgi:hypothetical protein
VVHVVGCQVLVHGVEVPRVEDRAYEPPHKCAVGSSDIAPSGTRGERPTSCSRKPWPRSPTSLALGARHPEQSAVMAEAGARAVGDPLILSQVLQTRAKEVTAARSDAAGQVSPSPGAEPTRRWPAAGRRGSARGAPSSRRPSSRRSARRRNRSFRPRPWRTFAGVDVLGARSRLAVGCGRRVVTHELEQASRSLPG